MRSTPLGTEYAPNWPPGNWINAVWSLLNNTPAALLNAGLSPLTVIVIKRKQLKNAKAPMLVMLLPSTAFVRPVQLEKADSPTLVTLSGMIMRVRREH